jgi:electron transfer flavoprotein alpha subunit
MDHYHEAARDIEHQLYVQREELEKMITAATQTAVLQIARTHRIDVHFAPPASGKNLTPEFAARLRERWAAGANGA